VVCTKDAVKVLLLSIAVPAKLRTSPPPKSKEKVKAVPEMEALPVPATVLFISHVMGSIVWIPPALAGPAKELPVCVRVMENRPRSSISHPFDVVPDHPHMPVHVPVRGAGVGVGAGVVARTLVALKSRALVIEAMRAALDKRDSVLDSDVACWYFIDVSFRLGFACGCRSERGRRPQDKRPSQIQIYAMPRLGSSPFSRVKTNLSRRKACLGAKSRQAREK
jgi:hypothetical protein